MAPRAHLTPASYNQPQPEDQALVAAFERSVTVSQDSSVGGGRSNSHAVGIEAVQLQEQFVTVLLHTRIYFMELEKAETSQSFLTRFKVTLTTLPLFKRRRYRLLLKEEEDGIMRAVDTEEIFDILDPYWNFADYAPLEHLIKEFGTRKLPEEMKRYITELEQFEKTTTVAEFNSAVENGQVFPGHFITVTVPKSIDPAKCSLHENRKLKNEVLEQSAHSI